MFGPTLPAHHGSFPAQSVCEDAILKQNVVARDTDAVLAVPRLVVLAEDQYRGVDLTRDLRE